MYRPSSHNNDSGASSPASSQAEPSETGPPAISSWLFAEDLPKETSRRLELVNAFFAHIHRLRIARYVHKPTLLQRLTRSNHNSNEDDDDDDALLLAVCALGAKFLYCYSGGDLAAGTQWAHQAQRIVLGTLMMNEGLSVETALVVVLLHEHAKPLVRTPNRCFYIAD